MFDSLLSVLVWSIGVFAYSLALWPLFRRPDVRSAILFVAIAPIFLSPLLLPAQQTIARAISCFIATTICFKLVDLLNYRSHSSLGSISLGEYALYVVPFPLLLMTYEDHRSSRLASASLHRVFRKELFGLWRPLFMLAVGAIVFRVVNSSELFRDNFFLDHGFVVIMFVVIAESLSEVIRPVEHLCGYDTPRIMNRIYLSVSVGEFWLRYNTRVHRWLHNNIYLNVGGSRNPLLSIFAAFAFSGLFHEICFAISTLKFTGYQILFFLLQAPAVMAGHAARTRLNPLGATGQQLSRLATVVWFYFSSILFFDGLDRVFPFVYCAARILSLLI